MSTRVPSLKKLKMANQLGNGSSDPENERLAVHLDQRFNDDVEAAPYDLQAELRRNTPLQKLYEEVHFNKYNLAASVHNWPGAAVRGRTFKATLASRVGGQLGAPASRAQEATIKISEFRRLLQRDVKSISVDFELDRLVEGCPVRVRTTGVLPGQEPKEILFQLLSDELEALA